MDNRKRFVILIASEEKQPPEQPLIPESAPTVEEIEPQKIPWWMNRKVIYILVSAVVLLLALSAYFAFVR